MTRWLGKFRLPMIALLLLTTGAFFFYMLGQVDTLRCERIATGQAPARCTLTITWMNLVPLREQELGGLRQATIQDSCDSEGCTYRVFLHADRGGTALGDMFTSDLDKQRSMADQINRFLASSSPNALNISTGGGWFLIIPLLILAAGVIVTGIAFRSLFNPTE